MRLDPIHPTASAIILEKLVHLCDPPMVVVHMSAIKRYGFGPQNGFFDEESFSFGMSLQIHHALCRKKVQINAIDDCPKLVPGIFLDYRCCVIVAEETVSDFKSIPLNRDIHIIHFDFDAVDKKNRRCIEVVWDAG